MSLFIATVSADEILDSRGRPTVSATITLTDGTRATASAPSGASTGRAEAPELRDGDPRRFAGAGVRKAVRHVETAIRDALAGRRFASFRDVDDVVREVDAAWTDEPLGSNATVAVSMAAARAQALYTDSELWSVLSGGLPPALPVPFFNVLNGGRHAPNGLDFQEFMIAPVGAPTLPDAVRAGAEIYHALAGVLGAAGLSRAVGDEGGYAPDVTTPEQALDLIVAAIHAAGYRAEPDDVAIALDPAASEFYGDGVYTVNQNRLSATDMVGWYDTLVGEYPIVSIEDGLAEDDFAGWSELTARLRRRVQLVGDDIFVTDAHRIDEAARRGMATAALIKVNQIGTVSQALDAVETCGRVGFGAMISHRSGETLDTFIADLAVGTGCGQLKAGAPARGERVAKYNRLLEIARTNPELAFGPPRFV